ncbi:ribonuclease Z [Methanocaldococcus infernus]
MLEITFLGTGAAIPSKRRNHMGIALKFNGDIYLLDCGENIQRQFLYTNLSPMKIKAIFITHLHGDHILGIPGVIQSLSFMGRTQKLEIYGPKGIKEIVEMAKNFGYNCIEYEVEVKEIKKNKEVKILEEKDFCFYAYPTKHYIPSYAYIFKEIKKPRLDINKAKELGIKVGPDLKKLKEGIPVKNIHGETIFPEQVLLPPKRGICVAYSGDTLPIEDFALFLKNLDCSLLIHEATFDSSEKSLAEETYHSTVEDAYRIFKLSQAEKLILTHISARYDKEENFLIYKRDVERFNDNIEISEDLKKYEVRV